MFLGRVPRPGKDPTHLANRLQLQGELQSKNAAPKMYKGVFHGVNVIMKNEGAKGLFRGIGAAVGNALSTFRFTPG